MLSLVLCVTAFYLWFMSCKINMTEKQQQQKEMLKTGSFV